MATPPTPDGGAKAKKRRNPGRLGASRVCDVFVVGGQPPLATGEIA